MSHTYIAARHGKAANTQCFMATTDEAAKELAITLLTGGRSPNQRISMSRLAVNLQPCQQWRYEGRQWLLH